MRNFIQQYAEERKDEVIARFWRFINAHSHDPSVLDIIRKFDESEKLCPHCGAKKDK